MIHRHFVSPDSHYFLFGPRGTGKSTWLKFRYPNAFFVDLLDPEMFRQLSGYPEYLESLLQARHYSVVIVDEIQKVPALLDVIHRLIEQKQDIQFILTGSSARKLKRSHSNLLAGRALLKTFHPFVASELNSRFSLDEALTTGLLPLVWDHRHPREALSAYIDLHLKEEIQQEGLTRSIGNFSRFLEKVSFSHGSVVNVSNIARECEIQRKVVSSYMEILEDLLLASQLSSFSKKATRQVTKHPKFYFFDTGVFRYLRPQGVLDSPSEIQGQALEGLVYQHLAAWIDALDSRHSLHFWRTKSGVEVDFIVYGEAYFLAIEVKNASKIHPKDLRGLKEFKKDYPEATLFFLYRGTQVLKFSDILCVPIERFLLSDMNFATFSVG